MGPVLFFIVCQSVGLTVCLSCLVASVVSGCVWYCSAVDLSLTLSLSACLVALRVMSYVGAGVP